MAPGASNEPGLVMMVTSISGGAWRGNRDSEQGASRFSIADPRFRERYLKARPDLQHAR